MAATKQNNAGTGSGSGSPYSVPPEPNRWPSIALAVGMHALLLGFLWIGVSWQNNEPVAIEAEVWDVKTETAAPPPPKPAPQPEPEPDTPPSQPTPKAAEPPPPPPAPVEQPQSRQPDPEIALEREKKRKQELKRQQEEERERELEQARAEQKRADDKAKALAEKKAQDAADKKAQQLAEKKAQEAADKKAREDAEKKELAKKEEADKKKKAEKEKADKLAKEKADNAKLAKMRDDEMKRMMTAAGNTGSTGSAEKSTAPRRDTGYIAAITAKVKGNSSYGGDDPGNPVVTFHVEQLPTGEIMSVRMTKSSGIAAFDAAIERAIKASSPLPKKKDGSVERSLEINFKMKDMQ